MKPTIHKSQSPNGWALNYLDTYGFERCKVFRSWKKALEYLGEEYYQGLVCNKK